MAASKRRRQADPDVNLSVDEETLSQLQSLVGDTLLRAVVWEDSIADALADSAPIDGAADIDLYLDDGVHFELYAVLCYTDLDSDPLPDIAAVERALSAFAGETAELTDVAVDTENDLVLVFQQADGNLFLNAGAWAIGEWDDMPD